MIPVSRLARGLGWFSVLFGVGEFLGAPGMERVFGISNRQNLFRAFGLREIAAGLGILRSRRPTAPWLWARVGGDVLDVGVLGEAMRLPRAKRANLAWAIVAVLGVTALDVFRACKLTLKK